ncbi:hypothetical protein H0H87_007174 [Tephrocybe sp. NHM501043]|nr:hypothetical protein H0H87_007174 [Tephrocybe sp. NHM501043]
MPGNGRAPFTRDEERLLVKYLAKYSNPAGTGRAGNVLYKTLCEDVDNKWKWSRAHTWQSWRDRYYKNQEYYDDEIRKYQRKHNIVDPNPEVEVKNKGTEDVPVTQTKRKRGPETEEKRARVKREPEVNSALMPSQGKQSSDVFIMGKGRAPTVRENTHEPQDHDRKQQSRANGAQTDSPLQLPPNSPSSTSPLLYPDVKRLPSPNIELTSSDAVEDTLLSGGQRKPSITYHTSRRTIQVDPQSVASSSKIQLTPPSSTSRNQTATSRSPHRRKAVREDDVFFVSSPLSPALPNVATINRTKHRNPKLVEGPFRTHFSSRKSGVQSDDLIEDEETEKPWPPPRRKPNLLKGKGKGVMSEVDRTLAISLAQNATDILSKLPPSRPTGATDLHKSYIVLPDLMEGQSMQQQAGEPFPIERLSALQKTKKESFGLLSLSSEPSGLSRSHSAAPSPANSAQVVDRRGRKPTKMLRESWTPGNPSLSNDEPSPLTRRHSFANLQEVQSSTIRRLDLRAEMAKRRFAASSPFSRHRGRSVATTATYYRSPSSSFGRATPPITTERRRSSIIADEDRERIEMLGLTTAIEQIARDSGFQVDQIWRVYKHYGTVRKTEEYIRIYRTKSAELQELAHEQMLKNEMSALALADEQQKYDESPFERIRHPKAGTSTVASSSTKPSQEMRLKIKLMPDIELPPPNYLPPLDTRAGEWNRLIGQGRENEALSREHRRASGSGGVFPSLRSSPIMLDTPQNSSLVNGERFAEKDEVVEGEEKDVADSLLGETGNNAENGGVLSKDEEMMLFSAHAGIANELRVVEERVGESFMRRWIAAHFKAIGENEEDKEGA